MEKEELILKAKKSLRTKYLIIGLVGGFIAFVFFIIGIAALLLGLGVISDETIGEMELIIGKAIGISMLSISIIGTIVLSVILIIKYNKTDFVKYGENLVQKEIENQQRTDLENKRKSEEEQFNHLQELRRKNKNKDPNLIKVEVYSFTFPNHLDVNGNKVKFCEKVADIDKYELYLEKGSYRLNRVDVEINSETYIWISRNNKVTLEPNDPNKYKYKASLKKLSKNEVNKIINEHKEELQRKIDASTVVEKRFISGPHEVTYPLLGVYLVRVYEYKYKDGHIETHEEKEYLRKE